MKSVLYDVDSLIQHVLITKLDISPEDRLDWVFFCHALKVLGYDENTFVALSSGDEKTSRVVWKNEKTIKLTEDKARAKIVALAKAAGVDVTPFKRMTDFDDVDTRDTGGTRDDKEAPVKLSPSFVSMDRVKAAETDAPDTTLYQFLCSLFPTVEVNRVFGLYHIGATKRFLKTPGYASAFPYINADGKCVDVKYMGYNADGHKNGKFNWLKCINKTNDRRAPWCLFGDHLIKDLPGAPVGVVESEKTALVASLVAPSFVWVATGSLNNLNAERCANIKGRDVYLFPDNGGVAAWLDKAKSLQKEGFKIYFCGRYITDHAKGEKDDLADILINHLYTLNR